MPETLDPIEHYRAVQAARRAMRAMEKALRLLPNDGQERAIAFTQNSQGDVRCRLYVFPDEADGGGHQATVIRE